MKKIKIILITILAFSAFFIGINLIVVDKPLLSDEKGISSVTTTNGKPQTTTTGNTNSDKNTPSVTTVPNNTQTETTDITTERVISENEIVYYTLDETEDKKTNQTNIFQYVYKTYFKPYRINMLRYRLDEAIANGSTPLIIELDNSTYTYTLVVTGTYKGYTGETSTTTSVITSKPTSDTKFILDTKSNTLTDPYGKTWNISTSQSNKVPGDSKNYKGWVILDSQELYDEWNSYMTDQLEEEYYNAGYSYVIDTGWVDVFGMSSSGMQIYIRRDYDGYNNVYAMDTETYAKLIREHIIVVYENDNTPVGTRYVTEDYLNSQKAHECACKLKMDYAKSTECSDVPIEEGRVYF